MTWDHLEAAVFSAGIRSHRTASDGLAPEMTFPRTSAASSSWFASGTSARARNVARHWLTVALVGVEAKIELTMDLPDKEILACEQDRKALEFWLAGLGPFEPPPLTLTEDMRVDGAPLTTDELAQAVALGLRLQGSA